MMLETVDAPTPFTNTQIAEVLHEVADLLEAQSANPIRVDAYRIAAQRIGELDRPASELYKREGIDGLQRLPGIGRSLSNSIVHLIHHGSLPLLDHLRGDFRAERLFTTVPDIGTGLARKIHSELHIETLAELKATAEDGRLASVSGMGPKRIRAVLESLRGRLRGSLDMAPAQASREDQAEEVSVAEILSIDEEYRQLAKANKLPLMAPRRFNPTGAAWLPIMHTERGHRHYTALFSNTAHAHSMGTTHDWVVIYRDDHESHGRWTVITALYGSLRGKRIVCGREQDCSDHYRAELP